MIPARLIDGIHQRYNESERHYHSWAHIEALLCHYERWRDRLHRPEPVLWALYWHDAVYDPRAKDNEELSAQLLEREAVNELDKNDIDFAAAIIRATATHALTADLTTEDEADMALFLDMDLSILGAPESVFDRYEQDIRAEYSFVPEEAYRAGRGAVLKRFLERQRIYFTDAAHAAWDEAARANMRRALVGLGLEA